MSTKNKTNSQETRFELASDIWIPEAWIIEKERQKKKRKEEANRPCLQLPVPELEPMPDSEEKESQASTMIIIDL